MISHWVLVMVIIGFGNGDVKAILETSDLQNCEIAREALGKLPYLSTKYMACVPGRITNETQSNH